MCKADSLRFFWQNGPGGLIHHDDFYATIASNVFVHRHEIKSLDRRFVRLEGGEEFHCDAIVCGTGWNPSLEFLEDKESVELGLPMPLDKEPKDVCKHWEKLVQDADHGICTKFPVLANPPKHPHQTIDTTTYRLYQGMAPVQDNSILFLNHVNTANKFLAAGAQAMWAVAYFDKQITLPSKEDMERSIATWVAFSRRRYLSQGEQGNAINFESITYTDALLAEMSLTAHKKRWWDHWFTPFRPEDLGKA